MTATAASAPLRIALVGNPNSGKTALFNQLTGSRQKVANYTGVTVERKEGRLRAPSGREFAVLDLPGAYSLHPASLDEAITRDLCRGFYPGEAAPDVLLCVIDATNLRLHLRFALELRELGKPMVVALNMVDAAQRRGIQVDVAALERELGVPVVETVAVRKQGARALVERLDAMVPHLDAPVPGPEGGIDYHARVREILSVAVRMPARTAKIDDALDRWLLHPVFGLISLAVVMFLIFQAVYAWATPLMDGIEAGFAWLGTLVGSVLPEGPLASLLTDGIIAGVGGVVVFLPQILILFFFILVLEESGYLPRAAFLLDRMMAAAGLSGRSFIPLLSSFACAVPGIMSTRSIQDPRDRLATILVAPLMTCSARLPVYALLIGAFIPQKTVWGVFNQQGLVLFGLYAAGILSALAMSWIMKKWRRDKSEHPLMLELPSYRLPHVRDLAVGLYERGMIFLKRVGGIILALTILLWVLLSFPAAPVDATLPAIDYSYAGRIGHAMAVFFAPLGFNWQICIALIPGLAAREVAVSSLATVYALSAADDDAASQALTPLISDGWSLATALSLLVWYIYAPMCISTLATIKRETNSWKQMGFAAFYLFAAAYVAALITYQVTRALGGG
ncbi:ferrous iron transporter B [Mesorhizobium sp. M00.F.Ca.ET.151.01.1.1]|uniref:ferrous iron transporter B n=1 Tax=Stenotrophomonas pavanii TaxID=487698 RepID=UPI00070E58EC|nr:ferrous iron transporter B [Stenotrophomonas pavanii]TGR55793.1 ferrous iron transporter B [bacterium M00.F.Ca.ET.199.01.1.1]TGT08856.1 ferrous iron transporter B [bacterium M00.F.Ca.ET.177.01.1.1]TGT66792.1 ferrous iron transporter B [Mesorhizobium sp. M00.F.Ca.ET.170.01.1.1]TGU15703.1 ferrous iron transporter B [bacterium M00.F.Ca.ET.163.01.1.1]TGU98430.1 ferrous iron transporter B [Mesorhizobium sp. M00.F.Ca.ET.151.01.1.1]TGV60096.1 ferrous iron transporter B [bacterium M00.F.Ca.ET.141.